MEELIRLVQSDPELWEIVEKLKDQDQNLDDFFLSVANMLAIELEELHRTDFTDKLVSLFGGLPEPAFRLVAPLCHVALDIFLMKAIPTSKTLKE